MEFEEIRSLMLNELHARRIKLQRKHVLRSEETDELEFIKYLIKRNEESSIEAETGARFTYLDGAETLVIKDEGGGRVVLDRNELKQLYNFLTDKLKQ